MQDLWYNVLLNADIEDLSALCYLNNQFIKICSHKQFWLDKFAHHKLPYLIYFSTISNMIQDYKKILKAKTMALDITNDALNAPHTIITINDHQLENMVWLPKDMVDLISSIDYDQYENDLDMNSFLRFNITTNPLSFNMTFELAKSDIIWDTDESVDFDIISVNMTYDEFVLYLTKLFYYEPQADIDIDGMCCD